MSRSTLTVACVQNIVHPHRDEQKKTLAQAIKKAAQQGAELVVLQELHNDYYFCQTENAACFDLAEPIPGSSTAFYASVAQEAGVVLVTSLFERRGAGLHHNTAVVFERDGSCAGVYRKMHIPTTLDTTKNFISRREILVFDPLQRALDASGFWCAGINGFRKLRASWPWPTQMS